MSETNDDEQPQTRKQNEDGNLEGPAKEAKGNMEAIGRLIRSAGTMVTSMGTCIFITTVHLNK